MNEPMGQLTSNLDRATSNQAYRERYFAMLAHAHELERQLEQLRKGFRTLEERYIAISLTPITSVLSLNE